MKLEKKFYSTRAEKQKDLALGIGVFLGLNFLLYVIGILVSMLLSASVPSEGRDFISLITISFLNLLPFLINIGVLIYFALTRTWIALGMIATFGGLILLTVILGIIATIICFTSGI